MQKSPLFSDATLTQYLNLVATEFSDLAHCREIQDRLSRIRGGDK